MAGHQQMSHGMPMNTQMSTGVNSGMSPMTVQSMSGQQMAMSQPQKMIPSPQVQHQQQHLQQQQLQQQQQQQQQQLHQPDSSSIEKIKSLVPHLKKALANLMRAAGEMLRRDDVSSTSGSTSGSASASTQSVEKSLEEFFAICDQLEMQLAIALEGFNQVIRHKKYLNPEFLRFSFPAGQSADVVQQYNAFSTLIRSQVALASSLHDALVNCADQMSSLPAPTSTTNATTSGQQQQSWKLTTTTTTSQPQSGTTFSPGGLAVKPVGASNVVVAPVTTSS